MSAKESLVSLDRICRVYYTEKLETRALWGLSMSIEDGEFVSINGPSGCGKSTLLSILGLLDAPTSGTFMLNGVDVSSLNESQRAHIRNREIGIIFQDFNLIGDLSVRQNVELPLIYGGKPKAERRERVEQALAKVDMSARADHQPGQLSGGQQQRVAIARALAGDPSLLLADEPTGNLDSRNGEAVMGLLSELNESGVTICMVTHDHRYANHAKRVVQLLDGKVDEATPTSVGVVPSLAAS